jgi:hypothetical protein
MYRGWRGRERNDTKSYGWPTELRSAQQSKSPSK